MTKTSMTPREYEPNSFASLEQWGLPPEKLGIIVVDHGSRRRESNEALLKVVELFQQVTGYPLVEAAHMELAGPSIKTAFNRCVQRGAQVIVVFPYFLLPGRHWDTDIPHLCAEAAEDHPPVKYLVTAPLGVHRLMAQIMNDRIIHCLAHALGDGESCEVCAETDKCQVLGD